MNGDTIALLVLMNSHRQQVDACQLSSKESICTRIFFFSLSLLVSF